MLASWCFLSGEGEVNFLILSCLSSQTLIRWREGALPVFRLLHLVSLDLTQPTLSRCDDEHIEMHSLSAPPLVSAHAQKHTQTYRRHKEVV